MLIKNCITVNCPCYVGELKSDSCSIEYGFPKVTPRIPQRQLLLEMAALVKEQMSGVMNVNMKSFIRPLPRFTAGFKPGAPGPHTEIVLYEDPVADRSTQKSTVRLRYRILPNTRASPNRRAPPPDFWITYLKSLAQRST